MSIRSCELQTLAPRLPPFTDTPHPTSMICWASHERAGVGMIGRCVTAQPACAYYVPSSPGTPIMFRCWHCVGFAGGLAGNAGASCLLAFRIQVRVPNYFLLPRRCCRIGNFFFPFFSSLSLSPIPNNSVHSFPTRCRWCHFATTHGALRTICFCLCSLQNPTRSLVRP